MKKLFGSVVITLLLLSGFSPSGAEVSVTLKLDRTEANLEDQVGAAVTVSGTRNTDGPPILKGVEGFDVSPAGTSTRVEIINGQVRSGIDYTYTLQPRRPGTYTIGPAEVTVEGKTLRSNSRTLTVSEPGRVSGQDRGPVFLEAAISRSEAFVDEQLVYVLKLYTQRSVSDISLELPSEGCLAFRQLGEPSQYDGVYGGQAYHILEARYAAIPSAAGPCDIHPARMRLIVHEPRRRSPRGLLDDPLFSLSSGKPKIFASNPVGLSVLPLPLEGRPPGFSGLVGDFRITASLTPGQIKVGESATLTAEISGRGNLKRIPAPALAEPEGTKVYADQPVLNETADRDGFGGSRTMKWAIVPEAPGQYTIPPLSVAYFDPASRVYRTADTGALSISVLPAGEKQVQALSVPGAEGRPEGVAKKGIEEIGRDILPIHGSAGDLHSGPGMHPGRPMFWLALVAPLLIYVSTSCGLKVRRRTQASAAASKARKASRVFARRCREGALSSRRMILAVRDYLNDRLGLSLGSLTPREAADVLESRGVGKDTAAGLATLLGELENEIYTGRGEESCRRAKEFLMLVRQIEKEIR